MHETRSSAVSREIFPRQQLNAAIRARRGGLGRWGRGVGTGADERDARAKIVRLTPRGEESRRTIRRVFTEVESAWAEIHGEELIRVLLDTLAEVSGLHPAY